MKRKMLRGMGMVLLLTLLTVFAFAGCGGQKAADPTTTAPAAGTEKATEQTTAEVKEITGKVLFWHTYSDGEEKLFNDKCAPAFKEMYPKIELEVVRMPYDGLKQQVITAVSGEAAPDVMRMDIIWVPEFAKMGALEALDDKPGFADIKAGVFEGPLNTNYFNGKYYGLPLNTNTKAAIYNKELLSKIGATEAPKTFDELVEMAKKVKALGNDKWGIGIGGTHSWGMPPYFWTLGGLITDEKFSVATGYLNSDASVKALEKIVALNDEKLIGPCLIGEEPNTWGGMEANNYLMIDDGPWYFSIQKDKGVEEKVICAPIPEGPGGSRSIIGGEDVVMFGGSKNKEAAWAFMQFLMGEQVQTTMAETGLIPGLKAAANSDIIKNNPITMVYIKQLETAFPRTPSPNWEKISEQLGIAYEKAVRKQGTPKELLDEAAKKIDELLKS